MLEHLSSSYPTHTTESTSSDGVSVSFPQEILGNALISIDHSAFLEGYQRGYASYQRVGRYLPLTTTLLRDVLLKRCLEFPDQPSFATTGYIVGWITAMQGLSRRQRLCPVQYVQPSVQEAEVDPQLAQLVPSLTAHPDFVQGLADGRAAYRAHDLVGDETESVPNEQQLVHLVAGTLSYKAYRSQCVSQGSGSYPYRLGFAFGQVNAVVEHAGGWPARCEEDQQQTVSPAQKKHTGHEQEASLS